MALYPSRSSRRDFLRGGAAAGAATLLGDAGLGRRAAAADSSAWQEYLAPSFILRDLAEKKGKIITFQVSGSEVDPLAFPTLRRTIYEQGNGVECDGFRPSPNTLPSPNLEDADWYEVDKVISFAQDVRQNGSIEHFAAQSVIFGLMFVNTNTSTWLPRWMLNDHYTYSQTIQMANQWVKDVMLHLQQQKMLNPKDPNAGETLRVGVLNELLNENTDQHGNILIDVNDPTTWFRKDSYWNNQAYAAGDPFKNGYPEYVKQALLIARKYAGDALLGIADFRIETWHDFSGGGPNQKALAMYNLIKFLQADPDLKEVFDKGFYVGMQGHFEWNMNLQSMLQTGVDTFAQDVGETIRRFKDDLGVEVVMTETTIAQSFNGVTISDSDQANIENALALAAFQNGVQEWVVFDATDFNNPAKDSIFDAQFNRKLSYAGLAAALDGKRITF